MCDCEAENSTALCRLPVIGFDKSFDPPFHGCTLLSTPIEVLVVLAMLVKTLAGNSANYPFNIWPIDRPLTTIEPRKSSYI